ncbi:24312_t:CDS:2 [Gigaspora margarita]|uniref:24312_t:CDS:1 n=1 Tax=Gigaspora margarita TaxID=4874 RepID=A0ABN7W6Y4_GIGMA|nr:24312_t:CDS:2 [Gigaspora margarita]
MDQMLLDIDTSNNKSCILVAKEELTTYILWNLPQPFNNEQVKRLIGRYSKVQEIHWTCGKFSKQAYIILSIKNKRSKKMLEDSWVLPIRKKLTRITVEDNQGEDLELNIKRITHKNNLGNKNKERSGCYKTESLNTMLQEILYRLEKIKNSYSTSRATATLGIEGVYRKTQVAKDISKKEGLREQILKKKKQNISQTIKGIWQRIDL